MAWKFTEFLNKLSTEPATAERYKAKPEEVMIAEGLTPAERTLLLSGDAKLILAAFYKGREDIPTEEAPLAQQYQAVTYITIVHP